MIEFSIRHNFPQVISTLSSLPAQVGNKVMARALNNTINMAKPAMAKQITGEFKVSSAEVKDRLEVERASSKGGQLKIEVSLSAKSKARGRSMNLIAFQTGLLTKTTAKRAGNAKAVGQLGFQIKRLGGRKIITGAFIANKGRTVFIRMPGTTMASRSKYAGTKHAQAIASVSTIDIPQMFNTKRINQVVVKSMLDNFDKQFARELRTVLEGWSK